MNSEYKHVYVIMRSDDFLGDDCPTEEKVTAKAVVWSREEAAREVARLNGIGTEGVRYFWQVSRLIAQPIPAKQENDQRRHLITFTAIAKMLNERWWVEIRKHGKSATPPAASGSEDANSPPPETVPSGEGHLPRFWSRRQAGQAVLMGK